MELQYFGFFFGYGAVGGEHDVAAFCSVGEQVLIFEVEEGEGGIFDIGGWFDGLVLILGMYVEDDDLLVEEEQCY